MTRCRVRTWVAIGVCACATQAWALRIVNGVVQQDDAPKTGGFSLPKEDDTFTSGLEDFDRYRDKKQWEAAFKALTKLGEAPLKGFTQTPDGLLVPSRERLRAAVLSLPADGLGAYRLFYDAQAKKLFDDAVPADVKAPVDDVTALKKIVDQYFLTAVGANAADRLADAYFESGNFGAAADLWRLINDNYPDPPIPAIRLAAKRAAALARLKRWDAFDEIARSTAAKYPGETITVAGKALDVAGYFAALRASATPATAPSTPDARSTPAVPVGDGELWQTEFLAAETASSWGTMLARMGWGRFMDTPGSTIPPAAVDADRVYVNWIGIVFAVDVGTGKLAWRTSKFSDFTKQGDSFVQMGTDLDRFALVADGGRVFAVGAQPTNMGMEQQTPVRCFDGETGKVKWASTSVPAVSQYNFCGVPVVSGDTLFAIASKQNQAKFEIVALDVENGKMRWSSELGTPTSGQSFRGTQQLPSPQLVVDGSNIFVLTNNGATLCVDADTHGVKWAVKTDAPPVMDRENMMMFSDDSPQTKVEPNGTILSHDGLLYLKEKSARMLYAVDPSGPTMLWKRPLGKDTGVAAFEGDRLLTVGTDAGAIGAGDHALKWSTPLRVQTGGLVPVVAGKQMLVSSARGIYRISTDTGDVLKVHRGADKDTAGGALFLAGDKLINVTNRTVTAYPLADSEGKN